MANGPIDTGTDQLLAEVKEGVAVITLNRPDARNALSDTLTPALRQQIAECAADPDVGALLITGAGTAFCAGGDVKSMDSRPPTAVLSAAEVTRAEIITALKKEAMHGDSASSRVRALELLGKTLSMFTDRTEIEQRPSFADEIEALQPAIQIAKEEMKKRRGLSGAELPRDTDEAVEIAMRSVHD